MSIFILPYILCIVLRTLPVGTFLQNSPTNPPGWGHQSAGYLGGCMSTTVAFASMGFPCQQISGCLVVRGNEGLYHPRNWTQIPQNSHGDERRYIFPSDSFLVSTLDFGDVPFVHMFQSVFSRFIPSIPYMHQSGNSRRVYFRDKQKSHCF